MATSTDKKAAHHSRPISLPSKSHSVVTQLDKELRRLKSSEAASTSHSVIRESLGSLQSYTIILMSCSYYPIISKLCPKTA